MTRTMTGIAIGLLAAGTFVAAQVPQQGGQPASQGQSQSGQAGQTVTYTGCVEAGSTPNSYILTNVTQSGGDTMGGANREAAGANRESSTKAIETQFTLSSAPSGFDWKSHVNQKVEVVAVPPSSSTVTSQAGQQAQQNQRPSTPRTITVRSARMVSDRCGL